MRKRAIFGLAVVALSGAAWALDGQQMADIQMALVGCFDMQQAASDLLSSEEPMPPETIPVIQSLQVGAQQVQLQLLFVQAGG